MNEPKVHWGLLKIMNEIKSVEFEFVSSRQDDFWQDDFYTGILLAPWIGAVWLIILLANLKGNFELIAAVEVETTSKIFKIQEILI